MMPYISAAAIRYTIAVLLGDEHQIYRLLATSLWLPTNPRMKVATVVIRFKFRYR